MGPGRADNLGEDSGHRTRVGPWDDSLRESKHGQPGWLRCGPGVPATSVGLPAWSLLVSLPLSHTLSLSLSLMNK